MEKKTIPTSPTEIQNLSFNIPLFPLPKMVFFPRTTLPLMVYEPRYLAMVHYVIAHDKIIGMPYIKPGFESRFEGEAEIFPIFGFGVLTQAKDLPDGRISITLQGLGKCQMIKESLHDEKFRIATVELRQDSFCEITEKHEAWKIRLLGHFLPLLAIYEKLSKEFVETLTRLDPEALCHVVAMNLIKNGLERQALLETRFLEDRMKLLETCIATESLTVSVKKSDLN